MNTALKQQWQARLDAIISRTPAGEIDAAGDLHAPTGQRWRGDTPFLQWRRAGGSSPPPAPPAAAFDDQLFCLLSCDQPAEAASQLPPTEQDAPLHPWTEDVPIEVWTDRELAAIHAAWIAARLADNTHALFRIDAAVRWHLDRTQPDNATNRPWAIHVFVDAAIRLDLVESAMYADTLLHNCLVSTGVPDPFAREILLDAREALDLMA